MRKKAIVPDRTGLRRRLRRTNFSLGVTTAFDFQVPLKFEKCYIYFYIQSKRCRNLREYRIHITEIDDNTYAIKINRTDGFGAKTTLNLQRFAENTTFISGEMHTEIIFWIALVFGLVLLPCTPAFLIVAQMGQTPDTIGLVLGELILIACAFIPFIFILGSRFQARQLRYEMARFIEDTLGFEIDELHSTDKVKSKLHNA
jgi:hypothetical protein